MKKGKEWVQNTLFDIATGSDKERKTSSAFPLRSVFPYIPFCIGLSCVRRDLKSGRLKGSSLQHSLMTSVINLGVELISDRRGLNGRPFSSFVTTRSTISGKKKNICCSLVFKQYDIPSSFPKV